MDGMENLKKIRSLLQHNDLAFVQQGLVLFEGLGSTSIDNLLERWAVISESESTIVYDSSFTFTQLYEHCYFVPQSSRRGGHRNIVLRGLLDLLAQYSEFWLYQGLTYTELCTRLQTIESSQKDTDVDIESPAYTEKLLQRQFGGGYWRWVLEQLVRHSEFALGYHHVFLRKRSPSDVLEGFTCESDPDEVSHALQSKGYLAMDLSQSPVSEFPSELKWEKVEYLDISNTLIDTLPFSIGEAASLKVLKWDFVEYLYNYAVHANNQFGDHFNRMCATIQLDGIQQLTSLEMFSVSNQWIESVPEWIGDLTSLQILNLSHNRIQELPSTLSQLHNLKVIQIQGNPIKDLAVLEDLERLHTIVIDNLDLAEKYPSLQSKMLLRQGQLSQEAILRLASPDLSGIERFELVYHEGWIEDASMLLQQIRSIGAVWTVSSAHITMIDIPSMVEHLIVNSECTYYTVRLEDLLPLYSREYLEDNALFQRSKPTFRSTSLKKLELMELTWIEIKIECPALEELRLVKISAHTVTVESAIQKLFVDALSVEYLNMPTEKLNELRVDKSHEYGVLEAIDTTDSAEIQTYFTNKRKNTIEIVDVGWFYREAIRGDYPFVHYATDYFMTGAEDGWEGFHVDRDIFVISKGWLLEQVQKYIQTGTCDVYMSASRGFSEYGIEMVKTTHLGYGIDVILYNSGGSDGGPEGVEVEVLYHDNLGQIDEGEQLIEDCSEIVWSTLKDMHVKTMNTDDDNLLRCFTLDELRQIKGWLDAKAST